MFGFLKKKKHSNDFFGELVLSNGYWNGERKFQLLAKHKIEIQINCLESEIGEQHSNIWKNIELQYEHILQSTISEIKNYSRNDWLPFDLKENFGERDLQLESIFIDSDYSVDIHWGISPSNTLEFEYGVDTSFKNKKIEINTFIH